MSLDQSNSEEKLQTLEILIQNLDIAKVLSTSEINELEAEIRSFIKLKINELITEKTLNQSIQLAFEEFIQSEKSLAEILKKCDLTNYTKEKGEILLKIIKNQVSSADTRQLDRIKQGLDELNYLTAGVFSLHFRSYIKRELIPLVQARYDEVD